MTRIWLASLALLLTAACGGDGGSSVRSNREETKERRDEIKAIADTPEDASGEVYKLLRSMSDPDAGVRWRAEFGLGRIDARGIRTLAEALRDDSPKIRWAAAYVLGPHGKKAKAAVPALLKALGERENAVRVWVVKSLGDIDPFNSDVIAAMLRSVRDPEPDVRRVALAALIRLGPAARGSAPVLIDVLQDADAGIRAMACMAFRSLASDGKAGVPALIGRLADPDLEVRSRAAEALTRIGPDVLSQVVAALKDRDANTRRGAADVIGSWGGESKTAATDLLEAARDKDASVKDAATLALKRIQSEGGAGTVVQGSSFIEAPDVVARRTAGYKWARVGLFVHWGIYASAARNKPGQQAEWVMQNEKLPVREYEHLALKFGAENFKGEDWARLAKEAGARYVILTAKHHDGYCMWNTKQTEYSVMRLGGARRDLLGELAKACEKELVKFCAYYSMLDWHHPDYESNFPKYVDYMHAQVKELLTNYPIWGMWFDGEWGHSPAEWRCDELVTMIRQMKPGAFVNDRLGRETRGQLTGVDFYTQEPDATPAALKIQGRPLAWEMRQTLGDSWGYTESPEPLKSAERLIVEMVETVSKGGSYVINVGARPDGTIPEAAQARLKVVGSWLQKNGDAIYDTERGPFNGPLPAGRVTMKGNRIYVFLEDLPKDGIIALPGLKSKVREAWVLDGRIELDVKDTGIKAPSDKTEGPITVVAIEMDGSTVEVGK